MKRFGRISLLGAIAVMSAAAHAQVNLVPGGSVAAPAVPLNFVALVDSRVDNVVGFDVFGGQAYTGVLESGVWRRADGGLTFGWKFLHTGNIGGPGAGEPVVRFTMTDFSGFTTRVGQDIALTNFALPPGTVLSPQTTRSANGRILGWEFPSPTLSPGGVTYMMFAETNATAYTRGQVSIIDSGTTSVLSFAPVPEPATMLVLGAGLAALAARRRRRA